MRVAAGRAERVARRVALVLSVLAVVGASLAPLPRALSLAAPDPLALAGDVLPWAVVLVVWQVIVRRSRDVAGLPASVFRAAIVWGGASVLASQLLLVATAALGRRAPIVLAMTSVEDVLYGLGVLSLGALAAYAASRRLLRTAVIGPVGVELRDVPLRTRVVAMTAGVSFATAGVLLDVLVDFERTSDAALFGYFAIAAALVAAASLLGWLVGDDIAVREHAAAATAAERDRIARELHDGVAKSVSILALEAATAASRLPEEMRPELLRMQRLARMLSEEMRAILADVRSDGDRQPLDAALRGVVERHGPAELVTEGDLERIGTLARFEVLRIVDEALTNAMRYAEARRVRARVAASEERVTVEVEDDGRGIAEVDLAALPRSGRYGLLGIRERAELLHGSAHLGQSALGGTLVRVEFPLPRS